MKKILEVVNVTKDYGKRGFKTHVLKGISFDVLQGDFIAIMGPSGSGKTTLLNLISTLNKPTSGNVLLNGFDITKVSNKEVSKLRKEHIGFIFQDYNLLDNMSLMDNIALPLSLGNRKDREIDRKTLDVARLVHLEDHLKKFPYELSGGQKQRGSAARALITNPSIVFADEPTGALDSKSGQDLLHCLTQLNEERKTTILMVTHDALAASYAKQVYLLSDGQIKCRLVRGESRREFYDRILQLLASMGGERA